MGRNRSDSKYPRLYGLNKDHLFQVSQSLYIRKSIASFIISVKFIFKIYILNSSKRNTSIKNIKTKIRFVYYQNISLVQFYNISYRKINSFL